MEFFFGVEKRKTALIDVESLCLHLTLIIFYSKPIGRRLNSLKQSCTLNAVFDIPHIGNLIAILYELTHLEEKCGIFLFIIVKKSCKFFTGGHYDISINLFVHLPAGKRMLKDDVINIVCVGNLTLLYGLL